MKITFQKYDVLYAGDHAGAYCNKGHWDNAILFYHLHLLPLRYFM